MYKHPAPPSLTVPVTGRKPCDRLLSVLTCPLCRGRLDAADGALKCADRHTFNVARQGYISLLDGSRRPATADTPAMVQARTEFLRTGHYAPLARAVAGLAAAVTPPDGIVLEAGVGTGYYLATVLDALPRAMGLGLDTATHALRSAARAHPRTAAASWDVWQPLPVRTGAVDLVLNVFAPRNGQEFHRVLRPGGALLVVTPGRRHLHEIQDPLGLLAVDPAKSDRLHTALSTHFRREDSEKHEYVIDLTAEDITHLVTMSPSAHHVSPDELHRRIARLDTPLQAAASFTASVYRPRRVP